MSRDAMRSEAPPMRAVPNADSTEPVRKSLVMKLTEVMHAVERIPKNGRNEFHRYDYATEADIVAAIRGELASRHILLIPGITGRTREAVGEKGSILTHLDMTFTFLDGESGEELTRQWLGAGTDKEDKGAYKAMTGGEKFFLLKTFLIPTGDDPEMDTVTHPQAQENRREFESRKPKPQPDPRDPDDPLPTEVPDGATVITKVEEKAGTSKQSGKPYIKFTITDAHGRQYTTFSASLAKIARECRDNEAPVALTCESTKFGNDLIEIAFPVSKPTREAGQEG